ncbi:MAG: rod shape-determining protein MreD [Thermodesulfobacteriota bacterium]
MGKFFLTVIVIYFCVVCQSTIISEIFPSFLKPDLLLILVTYLGIYNRLWPGAIKTLASGLFYDSLSGSPFGLFSTIYLSIFFLIKLLEKILILGETKMMQMSLLSSALIFQYLTLPFFLWAVGIWGNYSLPKIKWLGPQILMTYAFAWPLLDFFKKIFFQPAQESSAAM